MSNEPVLPTAADFAPGTAFIIKEFDVPLVQVQGGACFNWYGRTPRPYDVTPLRVDNNWPADSFEEWVALVAESMKGRP